MPLPVGARRLQTVMRLAATLRKWLDALPEWPGPSSASLGRRGERAAARLLARRGMKIVAHGARDRLGEIDLVAVDGQTVVFVEVKTRASHDAGHPAEAVDAHKQAQLTRLALAWLKRNRLLDRPARFDVVAVTWSAGQRRPHVEHFADAFPAAGPPSMYG